MKRHSKEDYPKTIYAQHLQEVARVLLTDEEIEQRVERPRGHGSKWLLLNAQDDSYINALIFTDVIFPDTGLDCTNILEYKNLAIRGLRKVASI